MSWDLDEAEAVELAQEYLAAMPPPTDDEWVVSGVDEREWGWVISWVNERATRPGAPLEDMAGGGGPFLIDRVTGRVTMCGSAHAADHYIDLWRRGQFDDLPRPA